MNDISIISRNHFCSGKRIFFLMIHLLALLVSPDVWLSWFTTIQPASEQQSLSALSTYAALVFGASAMAMIRAVIFFSVSLRSSQNLHSRLVTCLLKAQVLFFDTNPAGRILNRCSKDIGCMDELLPRTFLSAIQYFLFISTAMLLPLFTNIWLSIVSVPAVVIFLCLTWYYLKTSRELKRLEAICRSPVLSHFSETMIGLDTIRSRKRENDFIGEFYR